MSGSGDERGIEEELASDSPSGDAISPATPGRLSLQLGDEAPMSLNPSSPSAPSAAEPCAGASPPKTQTKSITKSKARAKSNGQKD